MMESAEFACGSQRARRAIHRSACVSCWGGDAALVSSSFRRLRGRRWVRRSGIASAT